MSKKNGKGRKKKGNKNQRDYWYNPATERHELKPHIRKKRAAEHRGRKAEKAAKNAARADHDSEPESGKMTLEEAIRRKIPIREKPTGPCCADVDALQQKNEAMLKELLDTPKWAINPMTAYPEIIVIQFWFRKKHDRHYAHFIVFLKERGIKHTRG